MQTMAPTEFYAVFSRQLEERQVCEDDLNPLRDFLLEQEVQPWEVNCCDDGGLQDWQQRELIRQSVLYLCRHDNGPATQMLLMSGRRNFAGDTQWPTHQRLHFLNMHWPLVAKVHLLLIQVENLP